MQKHLSQICYKIYKKLAIWYSISIHQSTNDSCLRERGGIGTLLTISLSYFQTRVIISSTSLKTFIFPFFLGGGGRVQWRQLDSRLRWLIPPWDLVMFHCYCLNFCNHFHQINCFDWFVPINILESFLCTPSPLRLSLFWFNCDCDWFKHGRVIALQVRKTSSGTHAVFMWLVYIIQPPANATRNWLCEQGFHQYYEKLDWMSHVVLLTVLIVLLWGRLSFQRYDRIIVYGKKNEGTVNKKVNFYVCFVGLFYNIQSSHFKWNNKQSRVRLPSLTFRKR